MVVEEVDTASEDMEAEEYLLLNSPVLKEKSINSRHSEAKETREHTLYLYSKRDYFSMYFQILNTPRTSHIFSRR